MAERKGRWEVLEQSCGCCGVKNAVDGREWGYPMAKPAAEAVADFANWLEAPDPALGKVLEDWGREVREMKKEQPDVVRDVGLGDGTYEVQTLASSEEFKAALERGDHLVYARRQLGGFWDYIVEKFPEEVSRKDSRPSSELRAQTLLKKEIDDPVRRIFSEVEVAKLVRRIRGLVRALDS